MTIQEAGKWIGAVCSNGYDDREAAAITQLVLEKLTGMDRSTRAIRKSDLLAPGAEDQLNRYVAELALSRPVQYVLGEAWFAGLRFFVDERVLIPRPETEELLQWILNEELSAGATLLDIGTGSGCIPCGIGSKRKDLRLRACDVSEDAIHVAKANAQRLQIPVDFFSADLLNPAFAALSGTPDIVVSNPPYIPESYRRKLDRHVAGYEPALALFVPDNDPLLFYKKIGLWVKEFLSAATVIFLELHHDHAKETAAWFKSQGYIIEMRKDTSGNNRMLRAFR